MSFWYGLIIVMGIFAFGDFVGGLTRAKMSSVFIILMLFLIGFLTGILPPDILEIAELDGLALWAFQFLLMDMGSSVSFTQLKREWRTVVCSALAMVGGIVGCIIAIPLTGFYPAITAAPVINGAIGALNVMTAACTEKGLTLCVALGAFIYATQKFVGSVPASHYGLKEANRLIADFRARKAADPSYDFYKEQEGLAAAGGKTPFWKKHERFYTQYMCLGIASVFVGLSFFLANLTGGAIDKSLWCMGFGIALRNLGLVPGNFLRDKGNCQGLLNLGGLLTVIPSIATITVGDLSTIGFQAVVIYVLVLICLFIMFRILPCWKLVGSKDFAIGISMTQFLGFPTTRLVAAEISNAVGETQEERDFLMEKIGTAYVMGGFASVTVLSVFVASFIAAVFL